MQTVCPGPVESNILDYAFTKDVNRVRIRKYHSSNSPVLPTLWMDFAKVVKLLVT